MTTTFLPKQSIISNISKANPAVVTTSTAHQLPDDFFIRIFIPLFASGDFGIEGINLKIFQVTVLTSTTFSIPFNSSKQTAFLDSSTFQDAQVIPIGEEADTFEGSFRQTQ